MEGTAMNIKRISGLAGFLLFLTSAPVFAWRCERGFVDTGDSAQTVLKKCGRPDFIFGTSGKSTRTRAPALWYYDLGPAQLIRVLKFRGGILENMDTAGYGLSAIPQSCTPADLRPGMNVYALAKRCGTPRSRRASRKRNAGAVGGHTEIWTYDFGAQYLLHKVTITGGQVQSVETAGRPSRRVKPRR